MKKINWRIMRWGEMTENPESMGDDERELLLPQVIAGGKATSSEFKVIVDTFSRSDSHFEQLVGESTPLDGVMWHFGLQIDEGHFLKQAWRYIKTKQCHRAPVVHLRRPVKR